MQGPHIVTASATHAAQQLAAAELEEDRWSRTVASHGGIHVCSDWTVLRLMRAEAQVFMAQCAVERATRNGGQHA